MTVDEIFSSLSEHMIEGLMIHSQISDYFAFIGLDGYQEWHKYHYFEENSNYKKLGDYYLHHYNKIITERSFKNPSIIPENWYQYTRQDVNNQIRNSAVQMVIERWVGWEKSTKKLYETLYKELITLNEIAAAEELSKYIIDVDYELAEACQKHIELVANDYNISDIITEQKNYKKHYKKKIREIKYD